MFFEVLPRNDNQSVQTCDEELEPKFCSDVACKPALAGARRPVHQQRDGGVNPLRFNLSLTLGHTDEFTDEGRLVLLQHDRGLVSGPGLQPLN